MDVLKIDSKKDFILVSMLYGAKEYIPGTVVSMSCKDGYLIQGTSQATCLMSGKYSLDKKPTCKPCAKGCTKCTASACLVCNKDLYLVNGKCSAAQKSCKAFKAAGASKNGMYKILGVSGNVFETYCDMKVNGGGWLCADCVLAVCLQRAGRVPSRVLTAC